MAGAILHHSPKVRPPKPLVVRAGLRRTFGSFAGFAAFGFLSLGLYLLVDAFAHPVDAGAAALIVAAISIALAILLFFFLFTQGRGPERFRHGTLEDFSSGNDVVSSAPPYSSARRNTSQMDLPYQRAYVDRSRIRR